MEEHVVKGERDTNVENTRQASTAGTAASAGRHEKQLHGNHVVFLEYNCCCCCVISRVHSCTLTNGLCDIDIVSIKRQCRSA